MPGSPNIKGSRKLTLNIIWLSNVIAIFFYYLVIRFVQTPVNTDTPQLLFPILFLVGMVTYVIGFIIEHKFLYSIQQSPPATPPDPVLSAKIVNQLIIVFAFTEAPTIFGFVDYLLSGNVGLFYIFSGLSLVLFLYYRSRFKEYYPYLS